MKYETYIESNASTKCLGKTLKFKNNLFESQYYHFNLDSSQCPVT